MAADLREALNALDENDVWLLRMQHPSGDDGELKLIDRYAIRQQVFNLQYEPPADQLELGRKLVQQYDVKDSTSLTSCSTCHR